MILRCVSRKSSFIYNDGRGHNCASYLNRKESLIGRAKDENNVFRNDK